MENNAFKKYAKAWNKANSADGSQKIYTEEQIMKIKMKTSKDFSRSINNSIVFDYVHKSILIAGMLLLIWFYKANTVLLVTLFSLIAISILFIFKEFEIQKNLRLTNDYTKNLSEAVKMKLKFYNDKITPLKLMLAFTNALLVWVGSMFYFYSKYGHYKIEDFADGLVSLMMLSFAFVLSYISFSWLFTNNAFELEESLNALDSEQADILHRLLKRKRKSRMLMLVIAFIGVFLLVVLLTVYLKQYF